MGLTRMIHCISFRSIEGTAADVCRDKWVNSPPNASYPPGSNLVDPVLLSTLPCSDKDHLSKFVLDAARVL